jgi:hypothetical protein
MDLQEFNIPNLNNDSIGGTLDYLFAIEHSEVTGLRYPDAATSTTYAGNNRVDISNVIMTPGKLKKIESTEKLVVSVDEPTGDHGYNAYRHLLSFPLPGTGPEQSGFARAIANAKMVYFIIGKDGYIYVQGWDLCPAVKLPEGNVNRGQRTQDDYIGVHIHTEAAGPGPKLILWNGSAPATIDDLENLGSGS